MDSEDIKTPAQTQKNEPPWQPLVNVMPRHRDPAPAGVLVRAQCVCTVPLVSNAPTASHQPSPLSRSPTLPLGPSHPHFRKPSLMEGPHLSSPGPSPYHSLFPQPRARHGAVRSPVRSAAGPRPHTNVSQGSRARLPFTNEPAHTNHTLLLPPPPRSASFPLAHHHNASTSSTSSSNAHTRSSPARSSSPRPTRRTRGRSGAVGIGGGSMDITAGLALSPPASRSRPALGGGGGGAQQRHARSASLSSSILSLLTPSLSMPALGASSEAERWVPGHRRSRNASPAAGAGGGGWGVGAALGSLRRTPTRRCPCPCLRCRARCWLSIWSWALAKRRAVRAPAFFPPLQSH
jgi:hypothetical protein